MKVNLSLPFTSRFGTVAMGALLAGMAALTVGTMVWSRAEIEHLQDTIEVSDAYNQTALSAAMSAVYRNDYMNSRNPEDIKLYQEALRATFAFEQRAKTLGTDEDRAYLTNLEKRYASAIVSASESINRIANGEFVDEEGEYTDVNLTEVTEELSAQAQDKREAALNDLDSFEGGLSTRSLLTMAAFALGLPLVFGSYVVTRRSERKDAVREAELERLKQAALTDALTGLANHRAFQEDLRREVARAARKDHPIGVAMLDVDDFKEINDSEGHARGDAVLAGLARLMSYVRAQDRGYRVGGDEFALIMPETTQAEAQAALERLRESIEVGLPGTTVSIGFTNSTEGIYPDALRDHADVALYEAKRRGKNQVVNYMPELSHGYELTAGKMQAIRRVLQSGEVSMWFQPIYRLGSRDLLAFEALLRLPAETEITGPQEAFEIAQSMGRSRELDILCVEHALTAAKDLPPDVKLFINLDPGTLANSRFTTDDIAGAVARSDLDPSRIVFEITERTIAPVERIRQQVDLLHALGFGVALDDVGAGNSGLELMRVAKFDYVKIDRSVILDALNGGQGRAVIVAIVAFARETGAFMIAEGIETTAMLESVKLDEDSLREFWVQGVQGFLLGEPRASMRSFLPPPDTTANAA